MAECRACQAELLWAKTEAGKAIPLDPTPTSAGNVSLDAGVAHVLAGRQLEDARENRAVLYMPHHATCPSWGRRQP